MFLRSTLFVYYILLVASSRRHPHLSTAILSVQSHWYHSNHSYRSAYFELQCHCPCLDMVMVDEVWCLCNGNASHIDDFCYEYKTRRILGVTNWEPAKRATQRRTNENFTVCGTNAERGKIRTKYRSLARSKYAYSRRIYVWHTK